MILLEFEWNNIFSLAKGKVSLADRGLCLVTGENQDDGGANGAGKSSFASKGIVWILYGQTPGGIKADAVINIHGKKKSGWGSITYEHNGDTYTVKRSRPAKLQLWKGDKEITAKKATETQAMIDQSLGRDFHTFVQTEMFGQGRNMNYASLQGAEQKKILEQILPIDTLDEWAEEAKVKANEVKVLYEQAKTTSEIEAGKLSTLENQYYRMKDQYAKWVEDNDKEIYSKKVELQTYEEQIREAQNKIEQLDINLKQVIRPTSEQWKDIEEQYQEAFDAETEMQKTIDTIRDVRQQWWERKTQLKGSLPVKIESLNCPTCDRPWDEEFVKEHNQKYEEQYIKFKEAEINEKHSNDVVEQYITHMRTLSARRAELENKKKCMDEEERKADSFMREKTVYQEFLRGEPAKLQEQIDALMLATNPHTSNLEAIENDVKEQKKSIVVSNEKVEALETELKYLNYWHKAYSKDMKLKLFAAACPYLDQATKDHLKALENSHLHVQFSTVKILSSGEGKEDFNVRCWNDTGGEGFDSLSGGEQQIVSFAIGRALADLARTQVSGDYQFQILDEPFTELDERNFEAVVSYLQKDIQGTVLLISNDNSLKGLISNRIHVVKKNGVSEVVV